MATSLASVQGRSTTQLRASTTHDSWGGDETVTLAVVDSALVVRLEWSGGKSDDWDLWAFGEFADIEDGDIILIEDDDLEIGLMVIRVSPFRTLKTGSFHHWEILTEEHELSVAEIKSQAGI